MRSWQLLDIEAVVRPATAHRERGSRPGVLRTTAGRPSPPRRHHGSRPLDGPREVATDGVDGLDLGHTELAHLGGEAAGGRVERGAHVGAGRPRLLRGDGGPPSAPRDDQPRLLELAVGALDGAGCDARPPASCRKGGAARTVRANGLT